MAAYFIDFEATSVEFFRAVPLQFCALKVDLNDVLDVDKWEVQSIYFMYDRMIPPEVATLTGINNDNIYELSGGLYFEDTHHKFKKVFQNGNTVIGHNIKRYDLNLYSSYCARVGLPPMGNLNTIDTLTSSKIFPWIDMCVNKKAETIFKNMWKYLKVSEEEGLSLVEEIAKGLNVEEFEIRRHNAVFDCITTALAYGFAVSRK